MEYVLYEMSYENLIMYGRVLPTFDKDKYKKGKGKGRSGRDERINGDDPSNRDKIRALLNG